MNAITSQTEAFAFPSVMHGIPFETYLEIEALNSHGAQTILDKSAYHFRWERENHKPASDAMTKGTLFHELVLEPEKAAYRIIPEDADKASNAGKLALVDFYCQALELDAPRIEGKMADGVRLSAQLDILEARFADSGLYAVKEGVFQQAVSMRDALMSKPIARALFEDGSREVTLLWRDREFGAPKKARVDWLPEGHEILVDLKTTASAGWEEAMKAIAKFGYRLQAAHYMEGARACGLNHSAFALYFVESEPPYGVRSVYIDSHDIAEGAQKLRAATRIYAECLETGYWPGYPDEIEQASLPKWAK